MNEQSYRFDKFRLATGRTRYRHGKVLSVQLRPVMWAIDADNLFNLTLL